MKLNYHNVIRMATHLYAFEARKGTDQEQEAINELRDFIEDRMKEAVADALREPRMHVGYTKEQVNKAIVEELEGILKRSEGSAWYFEVIKRIEELKQDD